MKLHPNARTTPHTRRLIVHRVTRQGWTAVEAAEATGISVRTVFKWIARFRDEGYAGLRDRPSTPRRSPTRTRESVVRRIERLRRKRWTAESIADRLRMALSTVSAVLKRIGLGRLSNLDPKPDPQRYERGAPGELLHIDTKKLARFRRAGHRIHGDRRDTKTGLGYEFVHVCIDDATRLAYAEVRPDERVGTALRFLRRAVRWFRRKGIDVQAVMTDNGNAYRSRAHAELCEELGIRHLRTRPYTPRTNGKAERFIQTIQRKWAYGRSYPNSAKRQEALAPWLRQYNHTRPHRGLARSTPAQRLRDLR